MIFFHDPHGKYWWLANFAPIPLRFQGREWNTVEHAFQAAKFAPRRSLMTRIERCATPGKAKATAKSLAKHKRADWEAVREHTMYTLTRIKFMQPQLRKRLFETGLHEIIEASHEDSFWGAKANGHGENAMGRIIMRVRADLRRKRKQRPVKP